MTLTQTDVAGLVRPADRSSDSYPANSNTAWYHLGTNDSVETWEFNNNTERRHVMGSAYAGTIVEQNFQGAFSLSFDLTHDPTVAGDAGSANGWEFLEGVVLPVAGDSDEAVADTEDNFEFDDDRNWFDLVVDQDQTDSAGTLAIATGCVVESISFDFQNQETVTVTMGGFFADTDTATDIQSTNINSRVSTDPYTFDEVTVSHAGYTAHCPQGATIDVEMNVSPHTCLGNRTIQHFSDGNVNPSVTLTDLVDESSPVDALDRALGASNVSSVDDNEQSEQTITITLDKAGTDEVDFVLDGSLAESISYNGFSADSEQVEAEINEMARGLVVDTNLS